VITPQEYVDVFIEAIRHIEVTMGCGGTLTFDDGVTDILRILQDVYALDGKVMLVGNGAEMSITSHLSIDFWMHGGIRALAFSDAAHLTALANDRGVGSIFCDPIRALGIDGDALFALSCSGNSQNVLAAAEVARERRYPLVTLTAFEPTNSLRKMGDINVYVPSSAYGIAESTHALIMHCILDCWMRGSE